MLAQAKRAEAGCGLWDTWYLGQVLCDRLTATGWSPTQRWAVGSRTEAPALSGPTVGTVDGWHHPPWSDPLIKSFLG